jgi:hypothetical protein
MLFRLAFVAVLCCI